MTTAERLTRIETILKKLETRIGELTDNVSVLNDNVDCIHNHLSGGELYEHEMSALPDKKQ